MRRLRLSFSVMLFLVGASASAQAPAGSVYADSASSEARFIHRFEADVMHDAILHTNKFLDGGNRFGRHINSLPGIALKYGFQFPRQSARALAYGQPRQGIGVARHWADKLLGSPLSVFVFQGAQIASLGNRLSADYEWKLGLTTGWETYRDNRENLVFGSSSTAMMNLSLLLRWRLSRSLDIGLGVEATHFSNGNTRYPNGGLNTLGGRLSLTYVAGRDDTQDPGTPLTPARHGLYADLMAYGARCTAGAPNGNGQLIALDDTYAVYGLALAPMYRLSRRFAAGLSLDAVWDRSANIQLMKKGGQLKPYPHKPDNQFAAGLSAHGEFIMPIFTINAGIGTNVIGAEGDFSGIYQTLTLKIDIAGPLYANIGYTLHDFSDPDHLMFGLGCRIGRAASKAAR